MMTISLVFWVPADEPTVTGPQSALYADSANTYASDASASALQRPSGLTGTAYYDGYANRMKVDQHSDALPGMKL